MEEEIAKATQAAENARLDAQAANTALSQMRENLQSEVSILNDLLERARTDGVAQIAEVDAARKAKDLALLEKDSLKQELGTCPLLIYCSPRISHICPLSFVCWKVLVSARALCLAFLCQFFFIYLAYTPLLIICSPWTLFCQLTLASHAFFVRLCMGCRR
jgi:hypothetical protein